MPLWAKILFFNIPIIEYAFSNITLNMKANSLCMRLSPDSITRTELVTCTQVTQPIFRSILYYSNKQRPNIQGATVLPRCYTFRMNNFFLLPVHLLNQHDKPYLFLHSVHMNQSLHIFIKHPQNADEDVVFRRLG